MILIFAWGGCYAYRSGNGTYHENLQSGGAAYAVWIPEALNSMDFPWLIIDRAFFHKSVKTILGQGDMPRLFNISSDGKSLIPVAK